MDAKRLAGRGGWIVYRLIANYWMLAVTATVLALPAALALLWLDRAGATQWLLAHGLSPVATADTAKDFVGVAAGVNGAFITLYFSITLIVLSMAAGNLGVRLIDRWLKRRLIRVSLAGLSFTLVVSLVAMMAVDAEAQLPDTPLLLVATVLALQIVNIAMLAVSLHGLGRTMFVDDSIDRICNDACSRTLELQSRPSTGQSARYTLYAPQEGYIESIDIERLKDRLAERSCRVILHAAPGQHVMKGELLMSSDSQFDSDEFINLFPIGPFRSDNQGVAFRIRLIVEIAARALSPAINDFYTALTCADKLAAVMESQTGTWVDRSMAPVCGDAPWLELRGQDFRGLFQDPLSAFRQAACQYPSVSIRMIDNYGRLARRRDGNEDADELLAFLRNCAHDLAEHAASVAQYDGDQHDIQAAYARHFETGNG